MSKRRKKARGNPQQPGGRAPRSRQRIPRPAPEEQSSPRILVYVLLGVAAVMGLYLHAYAMPQLTHFAQGLTMPDARAGGYSAEEIAALQEAMEDQAAGQLSFVHKTAGTIFPVAVFLAAWAALGLLARGRWRWLVLAAAAALAAVDITENVLIDQALGQVPPDPQLVGWASAFTTASWVLLALVGAAVVAVVGRDALAQRSGR